MLFKKFISMFHPKQKLRKPTTSDIKNNFACEDSTLEWHIKVFLNKEIFAKKCLQAFIEHMAYDDDRRINRAADCIPELYFCFFLSTVKIQYPRYKKGK